MRDYLLYPVGHIFDDAQDGPITYRRLRQVHQLCRLVDGNGVMTPSAQKVIAQFLQPSPTLIEDRNAPGTANKEQVQWVI